MNNTDATLRDAEWRVAARGPALREITRYCERSPVHRVDVWPGANGAAQMGVAWVDGTTTIVDWRGQLTCLEWLRLQPWAKGVVRVHPPG